VLAPAIAEISLSNFAQITAEFFAGMIDGVAKALAAKVAKGLVLGAEVLAVSARGCSGKRRGAGACRRGDKRVVCGNLDSGQCDDQALVRPRVHQHRDGPTADRAASPLIRSYARDN
jgi:hypothetical protein